jgi:hypothetical protein
MNIKQLKEKIANLPDDMEVIGKAGCESYDISVSAEVCHFEDELSSGFGSDVLLIGINHINDEDIVSGSIS